MKKNLQYSTLKITVIQYNIWHKEAGIEWTGNKSYWLEEGEEVRDGRNEGLSAIGDKRQAAVSLTLDVDGMQVHIFESSQLEGSYVRDLRICL